MDQKTAYLSSDPETGEVARFWRAPQFGDLECLTARFERHRYCTHVHDTFAIGVITSGAEAFSAGGERHVAEAGKIVVVPPGMPHDGEPAEDGFSYRMIYPVIEQIEAVANDIRDRVTGVPHISGLILDDRPLFRQFLSLHRLLESGAPRLEQDTAYTAALAALVARHADMERSLARLGSERGPIRRVREYLDAHPAEELSLDELAAIAGFSRFHLLRAFRHEVGITPHAYQTHRRVALAKHRLASTEPLGQVAVACGFFDQSHFSRTFKSWTGVTPGAWRRGSNIVQDGAT